MNDERDFSVISTLCTPSCKAKTKLGLRGSWTLNKQDHLGKRHVLLSFASQLVINKES